MAPGTTLDSSRGLVQKGKDVCQEPINTSICLSLSPPFFGVDLFIEIKQRGILAIGCLNSHYGGRLNLTAF